jgi:hypothetical protein
LFFSFFHSFWCHYTHSTEQIYIFLNELELLVYNKSSILRLFNRIWLILFNHSSHFREKHNDLSKKNRRCKAQASKQVFYEAIVAIIANNNNMIFFTKHKGGCQAIADSRIM